MLKIPSLLKKFCDAVWEYDPDTNEIYLHYDGMTPELCNQWIPYNGLEQLYREKYIYVLDLEIWERFLTPAGLRRFAEGSTDEEHFYIRFEHTQKGREWHEVYQQRMDDGHILLASRDVKDMLRNVTIAQAVMPEFDYVCCIDVASKSYVLYYSDANRTVVPQTASDNYDKILEEFNRAYVVPEEAEETTEKMRLWRVLKELEDKEEYIVYATVKEADRLTYKKLRFSYESDAKNRVLLTRIDVGELIAAQKLQEKEREKRLQYLQNMPVAFCSVKVLVDEQEKPYDFQFVYCNRAHEELEGVKEGELLGKNFYEFFKETDSSWLTYYYETAYQGISHVIRRFSPEIQKHLLIYTFQSERGHCECVLLDVSEEYFLTQELEHSRENLKRILETTTSLVFQYRPEHGEIILDGEGKGEPQQVLDRSALYQSFVEEGVLDAAYLETLEAEFTKMENGEHSSCAVIRCRLSTDEKWSWYRVSMFDFQDGYTHERKIFGYLQNIDQDRSREEEYRQRAQLDSLTGVYNAGSGRQEICERLEKAPEDGHFHALFVMDMDNFKTINDKNGHLVGDRALTMFAQVLRKTFRTEDVIYRLGGDEFVVFVERIHDPEQSIGVMLHRFHLNMDNAREEYPFLACSVGVFVTDKCRSFERCYEMADQALYETKKAEKGYYTIKKDE